MPTPTTPPPGFKIPRVSPNSHLVKALAATPRDGQWYEVKRAAMSSAEQIARQHNHQGAPWEFGYFIEPQPTGEIVSVLLVRSV